MKPERSDRLPLPDGLRGLAAFAVAGFHLTAAANYDQVPLVEWGWLGVPVFFVISGFVIPYSMRQATVTWRYAGRYALRRMVRLDPPLWATIVVMLLTNACLRRMVDTPADDLRWPGTITVIANLAYLQNLLRFPNLSMGLWTLCIEVQFYLAALLLVFLWQRRKAWAVVAFAGLTICSWMGFNTATSTNTNLFWSAYRTLFPQFCLFSLGITACWTRLGRCPTWCFWSIVGGCCLKLAIDPYPEIAAGIAAAVLLHLAANRDWISRQPIAYLGKISYSLYLMHWPAGRIVLLGASKLEISGPWLPLLALAVAVGAADLLSRFIEQPAMRLSRRIELKS